MIIMLAVRAKGNNTINVNLADMESAFEDFSYDGTSWKFDAETARPYIDTENLIFGPGISLKPGTYTIVIDYNSTAIHKVGLDVEKGVIDTADYFMLSNNKNEVRYDFGLKSHVENFNFRIRQYYGGDFEITGMKIIRNNNDIRSLMFLWVLACVIFNCLVFIDGIYKNRNYIYLVTGIALLASLPLFAKGILHGDDIRFHMVRIEGIAKGLLNGEFPVRTYAVFNDDYGYPVPVYYGDVLLYFPAILRIIGFTIMQSYKAYIFLTNILTAAITFVCGKKMFKKDITAGIFALAYTLSTYRLLCLYARAAVGEYTATCFYPIVILAIWNIYTQDVKEKGYWKNAVILAIGMSGIVYNHVLSTEMMVLTLTGVAIVLFKRTFRKKTILVIGGAIVLCILISASFIVPFVEFYKGLDIMLKSSITSDYIQANGAHIADYFAFFKSITGGTYSNRRGLHTPGLILMVGLLIGFYLIATKKADNRIKVTFVGSVVMLFVASDCFPWNRVYEIPKIGKMLVTVQFQYRYIGIAICFLSVLLCLCIDRIIELKLIDKKLYAYIVLASTLMTCFFLSQYLDERFAISINNSYDTADLFIYSRGGEFGMYELIAGQYLLDGTNVSKEAIDYGEDMKASVVKEDGVDLTVKVDVKAGESVELPRFAYPYIIARDKDGNKLDAARGNNNKLTVNFAQPYTGEITVGFEEPWHWRVAEIISLLSIGSVIVLFNKNRKTYI